MLILNVVKVLCFDTLLQVFILNGLLAWRFALRLKSLGREIDTVWQFLGRVRKALTDEWMEEDSAEGAGFACGLRRTGWGAHFMSYDSTELAYCQ